MKTKTNEVKVSIMYFKKSTFQIEFLLRDAK